MDDEHGVRQLAPAAEAGGFQLAAATAPGAVAFALAVRDTNNRETIRLCDAGGKVLNEFEPPAPTARKRGDPPDQITALALSADGTRVVLGTRSGRVVECDLEGKRNWSSARSPTARRSGQAPGDSAALAAGWLRKFAAGSRR